MATATKKTRAAARPVAGRTRAEPSVPVSLEFLVHQDNGGGYHWEIVAGDGASLAKSAGFASHEDAERAARRVKDEAGGARFEPGVVEERPLVAV
jgi:uncharacterized protein YegP (UPF0339 family)